MDDLISRQAAIDALKDAINDSVTLTIQGDIYSHNDNFFGLEVALSIIQKQPSVQPKHGRWIRMEKVFPNLPNNSDYRFECSECGWSDQHNDKMVVPYCWHCGALMDEVEE